jgi:hypothetical protein
MESIMLNLNPKYRTFENPGTNPYIVATGLTKLQQDTIAYEQRNKPKKPKRTAEQKIKYKKAHDRLHASFEALVRQYNPAIYPHMEAEFQFHPTYRYRFDYCWKCWGVAVDIQGGIYINRKKGRGSGHVSIAGMERDMMKINLAQSLGWIMLQISPNKIRREPDYVISMINAAIQLQVRRKTQ